jgi:hypothetical protein
VLEEVPFDGELVINLDVTVVEELKGQFAKGEMVTWNLTIADFDLEKVRDDFTKVDFEGVVGRSLDDAAMHVATDEVEKV